MLILATKRGKLRLGIRSENTWASNVVLNFHDHIFDVVSFLRLIFQQQEKFNCELIFFISVILSFFFMSPFFYKIYFISTKERKRDRERITTISSMAQKKNIF